MYVPMLDKSGRLFHIPLLSRPFRKYVVMTSISNVIDGAIHIVQSYELRIADPRLITVVERGDLLPYQITIDSLPEGATPV